MTAIAELALRADPAPWSRIGLVIDGSHATIGGVRLRFEPGVRASNRPPGELEAAITRWGLAGLPADTPTPESIDGLVTYAVAPTTSGVLIPGDSGIVGFDHLVVMTSSLERTCQAITAATGEALRRVREAGEVRQGFHRLGEVIVEVVESAAVTEPLASFWGFVWNVADIHEVCAELGPELIGLPRPAVQPGRFIASFRRAAGLGLPIAIMSAPVSSGS